MPVAALTRVRSSLNFFHAVSVFGCRLRFLFFRKSDQTCLSTPAGSAHGRGEEPLGSDISVSVSVSVSGGVTETFRFARNLWTLSVEVSDLYCLSPQLRGA